MDTAYSRHGAPPERDFARAQVAIDECLQGDVRAWRELHAHFLPVAGAFLRKLGVRESELEDATQEVFLQLFRYLPRFRREAELSTWLYRLCITQARHARRRARVNEALSRILPFLPTPNLVSTPSLPEHVARARIEQALAQLSEGERTVFVLYEMEGVSGKEIAQITEIPEASVWRRLHYARKRVRVALGDHGDDEPAAEAV
ncbi:MAG TPA: sigma-70 family RNA polymerase sigma factor [Polyangiaceae bacterium]|jgi:RNA polymerase sigma-70 factor (ECF subfamily)